MSRSRAHLSLVVDEVLEQAHASARRRDHEEQAIKTAAAQPRTDIARSLRALADSIRNDSVDVSYADLAGAL
jgi:hypothetical protein